MISWNFSKAFVTSSVETWWWSTSLILYFSTENIWTITGVPSCWLSSTVRIFRVSSWAVMPGLLTSKNTRFVSTASRFTSRPLILWRPGSNKQRSFDQLWKNKLVFFLSQTFFSLKLIALAQWLMLEKVQCQNGWWMVLSGWCERVHREYLKRMQRVDLQKWFYWKITTNK